jgi:flagellar basal body-associated protein FliL
MSESNKNPPNGNSKIFLVIGSICTLLIVFAYGYFNQPINSALGSFAKEEIKNLTLPSLTVNLADVNRRGYLKTTITLEYTSSKKLDKELEEESYKIKDTALRVFRNTTSVSLSNPQETELIKLELLSEINSVLENGKIDAIYFEEFIVQ